MNVALFLIGIGKILFGILVGALGVWLGSRVLGRVLRLGEIDAELGKGNTGVAVISAAGLLSLGLLAQHAVSATFAAMDFMYRGQKLAPVMLGKFTLYGLAHVAFSLAVGAAALTVGTFVFVRLTRGVDELAEIRKGNVAPALVLGAVMVVIALVAAPGLETALDGLLPLPQLARDEVMAPS
ncbi:DUF350 domain-containing protein [Polyangium mundeleinium]|uniref:DUF350 domain-containing protein n=1 Tax=Polyangium mundeleinium TaxID=2995306 RepID=A0ABT5F4J8_9BACT|nr:DUF350 domain-containing protein [Polyangium mundeleinium]MDC0748001.1 DUF350 domain-containing protein [Polyangium mundeleinium]